VPDLHSYRARERRMEEQTEGCTSYGGAAVSKVWIVVGCSRSGPTTPSRLRRGERLYETGRVPFALDWFADGGCGAARFLR
jgi:hypothetical protein